MLWKCAATLCCLAVGACHEPEDVHLFFPDIPYPVSLPESQDDFRLEFVREYGDRDQGLLFGQITGLAVSESGMLAVIDGIGCQIWIVDTQSGSWTTIGGCGDGPGEFRAVRTATFIADTLVAFEARRMELLKLTLAGEELGRSRLLPMEEDGITVSSLYVGGGGSILAGLDLMPNSYAGEDWHIISFDGFGGERDGRGLLAPPVAQATTRPLLRPSSLCVTSIEGDGEVVVTTNIWGPQVAVLRSSDFEPLLSARVPIDWAQAQEDPERPGYWGYISPQPEVVCGDRYAITNYRRREGGEILSAAMVVLDLEQRSIAVLGREEPPEPGSVLFATPGAALGDHFFFFSNSYFDYPVVQEYRLVRAGGKQ